MKKILFQKGQAILPGWQFLLLIIVIGVASAMTLLLTIKVIGEKEPPQVVPPIDTNHNIDENNPDENVFVTPLPPECGNSVCEENETIYNCLADCFECNENATCEPAIGENSEMCPIDCTTPDTNTTTTGCGNLLCEFPENPNTCFTDCGICDNDDLCETQQGENENTCANDCQTECEGTSCEVCGNHVCEESENQFTCAIDCGCNNNDVCEQNRGENENTCENDCEINLQCTDNDNDLFFAQANCGTALDCNDNDNQIKPNTGEICADHVDNNCNGQTDELNSLQPACPCVTFDSHKNILVNGQKYFPIGFWAFWNGLSQSDWIPYLSNFSAISNGLFPTFTEQTLQTFNQKMIAELVGDPNYAPQYLPNKNIIMWEANFESPIASQSDIQALQSLVSTIKNTDVCQRPVLFTPGAIQVADNQLGNIQSIIDAAIIQNGYYVPQLALRGAGEAMQQASQQLGNKTLIANFRIEGYQPNRYRLKFREPTFGELRVQAYDSINNGAKGILFWPFDKGANDTSQYGFQEIINSRYDVRESPNNYANLQRLARDLKNHTNIFFSPYSSTNAVTNTNDIKCKTWDVNNGASIQKTIICANIGETQSPYFEYTGGYLPRIKAQAHSTDNKLYPPQFSEQSFDTLELNPNIFAMQDVSISVVSGHGDFITELNNQNKTFDKISIYFAGAPSNATFTYAIYADDLRDTTPHTRVFMSTPTAVPTTPGTYEFPIQPNITIEHTKSYYMLVKASTNGVMIHQQDGRVTNGIRDGPRIIDSIPSTGSYEPLNGPIELEQSFPALYSGKTVNAQIQIQGISSSSYCVEKDDSGNCSNAAMSGNIISDTFQPYAVHIYHLGN